MTRVLAFVIVLYSLLPCSLLITLKWTNFFFIVIFFTLWGGKVGHMFAITILNDIIKRLPGLVFALTIVAAKAERLRLWLHCTSESFERTEECLQKCSEAGRSLLNFDRLGRLSQKSGCVTEAAGELGAGSSLPFCSSIYWNQLSHSSVALHRDVKCFRCFGYCSTKCWKHMCQDFFKFLGKNITIALL